MKIKIVIVCGPTATGKTELAIDIAKKFNGELINVDSRQIYKYLDIGTNKGEVKAQSTKYQAERTENKEYRIKNKKFIKKFGVDVLPVNEISDVVIHLLSFLEPNQKFDVFSFVEIAKELINDIVSRGKLPILVGGTGLYIDALINRYSDVQVESEVKYKNSIEKLDLSSLQKRLSKVDYVTFLNLNESDRNNPYRLKRFLLKKLSTKSKKKSTLYNGIDQKYDTIMIYKKFDRNDLRNKIHARVEEIFKNGLVEEVKSVLDLGYSKDSVALQGTGYNEVLEFLDGEATLEEVIEKVKNSHWHYARRQITWFEGEGRGYTLTRVDDLEDTFNSVKKFIYGANKR